MVLQTSCRCLRQVTKGSPETALIYLNESNAEKLNVQLEKQHHISLKEFSAADNSKTSVKRYSRIAYLKLPKVDFYQLRINYDTVTVEKAKPKQAIEKSADSARVGRGVIKTTDLSMDASKTNITFDDAEYGKKPITFNIWVYEIMKGGFGDPSIAELMQNEKVLKNIYHK